ncbi:hypothetical protein DPMN_143774 [Dreissena polymorpha]|uniref:Uncharacterized protein n=1 Tax=Dreissena polymorpha TaxID=45954 RepID=A0A9D4GJS6_DREPO|nr:hypothetical protein DPMN_143774 [Dreissena polymorpha]
MRSLHTIRVASEYPIWHHHRSPVQTGAGQAPSFRLTVRQQGHRGLNLQRPHLTLTRGIQAWNAMKQFLSCINK